MCYFTNMFISMNEFLNNKELDLSYDKYIIKFDITKELFISNIELFYNELLYKLYYYEKEISIESDPKIIDKYFVINPLLIHENINAVMKFIYLESWYYLLDFNYKLEYKKIYELDNLNNEQLLACNSIKGVVNVLAPAGSGKTKTLVNRVLYLLNNGVKKDNILVLAYNKKAREELVNRLNIEGLNIYTFHSFGNKIINKYTNLTFIEDDSVNREILNKVLDSSKRIINNKTDELVEDYLKYIKEIKEEVLSKEEINNKYHNFYDIYSKYLELLEEYSYYTYEDMLYILIIMILKNPSLRLYLQSKYQYILVDESQDLNKLQLLLLKIIALPNNNLFLVGDDDQMIYSFRGASNNLLKEFLSSYSLSKTIKLRINYRSYENIVRHANWLIKNNRKRYDKDIVSYTSELGNINIIIGDIIDVIKDLVNYINDKEDIVIICRYNKDVDYLKCLLRLYNYETGYSYKQVKKVRSIVFNNNLSIDKCIIKYNIKDIDNTLVDILKRYKKEEQKELLNKVTNSNKVINITTVHKVKGNEYTNVVYFYNRNKGDIEEERRIFYVGVTRPKESLLIISKEVDEFIEEYALNENLSNIDNKKIIKEKDYLEDKVYVDKLKYELYKKDINMIESRLLYEINEDKELYLNKKKEIINNLSNSINMNKEELSLLKEEIEYRKALKK